MSYINTNLTINNLKKLIEENISIQTKFLPKKFSEEQKKAFETLRKRIFLEEIIEKTLAFNNNLNWENKYQNTQLVKKAEDLIEVFKLRSEVLLEISYQNEFPDEIQGLNFDIFDTNSAVIFCKINNEISGTIRLIFDSKKALPSEKSFSFSSFRKNEKKIGEISRNIVKTRNKGLNQEFKYLMCGIYNIFENNNIDLALSGIKKEHFKLFSKLGGVKIEKELKSYGSFNTPCLIISYDPKLASNFFKKVFLNAKML